MESNESQIDLKALGAELRKLRRSKRMSVVRFARELGKPAWLVDVIEHADEDSVAHLCSLLAKQEIASVQEEFMRLRSNACVPDADEEDCEAALPAEHTFYLPVTVSVEGLLELMDQLLLFVLNAQESKAERQQVLRQGVVSVSMLACLLHAYYLQAGHQQKARHTLHDFRKGLLKRLRIHR